MTLSISLHAPNNAMRSSMMPVNNAYPLEQLIPACRRYQQVTGRRISFEYSMVRGVNDSPETARELAHLIRGMGAHVNLIPINPVDGSPLFRHRRQKYPPFPRSSGAAGRQRHRAPPSRHRHQRGLRPATARGRPTGGQISDGKEPKHMKLAALTDIGSCRQENQDNYCSQQLPDGSGWGIVCDGMGGANGGRVAAKIAHRTQCCNTSPVS